MGLAKKSRSEEQDFTLVRMNGFEPSTPCMSSKYSNQLSYTLKAELFYHTFCAL